MRRKHARQSRVQNGAVLFAAACAVTACSACSGGSESASASNAESLKDKNGEAVHALFDLTSTTRSPFPSDRFTVGDPDQNTGRRINLPLPAGSDCGNPSAETECQDIVQLNELDGFSASPWIKIPFDGDIDPSTLSGNIFVIALGDTLAPSPAELDSGDVLPGAAPGRVIGLNQTIWNSETRTLETRLNEMLVEHTRYALIVTNGVRDTTGRPIAPSDEFASYRSALATTTDADTLWYRRALLTAEWAARKVGQHENTIVAASVFTTQSVSALYEKIDSQVLAGPAPHADFTYGQPGNSRAVFPFSKISAISHNQQRTTSATLTPTPISLVNANLVPGAIGTLATGHFLAPEYRVHPGEYIPWVATRTGTPAQQGVSDLWFALTLPSSPMPANGYPIIVFGMGSGANRLGTLLEVASISASYGFAVLGLDNIGEGFGPLSTWTVTVNGASRVVPAPGRAFDQNHDGVIGLPEGQLALVPRKLRVNSDSLLQFNIDLTSVLKMVKNGVDVDGDGVTDLDASHLYYLGQSQGSDGIAFSAYHDDVRATDIIDPYSSNGDVFLMAPALRPRLGSMLATFVPSLLTQNAAFGLHTWQGVAVTSPFFNEDIPFRDQSTRIDTIPGAGGVRVYADRLRWRGQYAEGTAFARRLRSAPPAGVSARPVLLWMARGDQTAPNPVVSDVIRAGDLKDRTVMYRHDLFYAANPPGSVIKNPHTMYRLQGPAMKPITFAIQEQAMQFFASEGNINQTSPYFEVPIQGPLPEDCAFIP